ncbi:PrgI family protein [Candidatus Daviesbacteria bacterium]|nr:PrgI family protein [Candidatus Daviesbacteria bacterium]
MEEHPVPQNVTDFEFHLVGDMTLKQFGYLAGGMVTAYIIFVTLSKSLPLVAYPLVAFFALSGTAFAFLPIQQRPLEHWLAAFLKAVFQPTQMQYKSEVIRKDDPFFRKRLEIYLTSLHNAPMIQTQPTSAFTTLSEAKAVPLPQAPTAPAITQAPTLQPQLTSSPAPKTGGPKPLIQIPIPSLKPSPTPQASLKPVPPNPLPNPDELRKTVDLAKQAQILQTKILETERELERIKAEAAAPGADPKSYTQKFQNVLTGFQRLNQEAQGVSQKLAEVSKIPAPIPLAPPVKAKSIPTLTLTSTPNIINGIVTDAMGNYIEGAIVVAHDKQNLPVRALKTNKLGQFIAATPLQNGSYTLITEKEGLLFDVVELTLDDQVLKPVVISAKKPERSIA